MSEDNQSLKRRIDKADEPINNQQSAQPATESTNLEIEMKRARLSEIPAAPIEVASISPHPMKFPIQNADAGANMAAQTTQFVPNLHNQPIAWLKLIGMDAVSNLSTITPQKVKGLEFRGVRDVHGRPQSVLKFDDNLDIYIPIPSDPPPDFIAGFDGISIFFADDQVLQFIENIAPKLSNVQLSLDSRGLICYSPDQIGQILHLIGMLGNKIYSYVDRNDFLKFQPLKQQNSIFDNVRSLEVSLKDADIELLVDWLNDGRIDEKPKLLKLTEGEDDERQKTKFVNTLLEEFWRPSSRPANFLIKLETVYADIFETNDNGEMLEIYPNPAGVNGQHKFIIRRRNNGNEKTDWLKYFLTDDELTYIDIEIEDPMK